MNRHPREGRIVASSFVILMLFAIGSAQAQGKPSTAPQNKQDEILARLTSIEAKLDAPSASTTFCISQGRGLDLKGKYAIETGAEAEVGVGWPIVADVNAKGKVSFPLVAPPFIPIPNEVGIELGGSHGRNFDICVEIPLALSSGDQAQLLAISTAMNAAANLGDTVGTKGKFQRRAARIINEACRKVRGVLHCPLLATLSLAAANADDDPERELDRADSASQDLLDGGLGAVEDGLQGFSHGNVKELLASLELPADVRSLLENPESIFDGLPDVSRGVPNCDSVQITASMRARLPRLNTLCAELSGLPDAGVVKGAFDKIDQLSDEVVDAIAQIVGPLLTNVGEAPQNTKARFCSSAIGQRPVFNRYCGR